MQKTSHSFRVVGVVSILCAAVLAACGGGGDDVNFVIPTAVPTSAGTPIPGATSTPVATSTNTPVPTNTDTPVPTNTNTPVATATNTPVPTSTATPVPAFDANCVPSLPISGQQINLQVTSVDAQASGQGLYPVGVADVAYTIASGNSFSVSSTNLTGYNPSPNAGNYGANGDVTSATSPVLADPEAASLITYAPSDWMQQAVRQPALAAVGGIYTTTVGLMAKGKLPNLLAGAVIGSMNDPQNNAILATLNATITRLPNETVATVPNACKYSVTLTRPNIKVDEDAALASFRFEGADLLPVNSQVEAMQQLELYMPMLTGVFATSKDVPFVPVFSDLVHTYGVSSPAPQEDVTTSKGVLVPAKALPPLDPAARQIITFISLLS